MSTIENELKAKDLNEPKVKNPPAKIIATFTNEQELEEYLKSQDLQRNVTSVPRSKYWLVRKFRDLQFYLTHPRERS